MKNVRCPKCKKPILVITRNWGNEEHWTVVEINHYEDAKRYAVGAKQRPCTIRMSFDKSQKLMEKLCRTGPSGLKLAQ